MRGALTATLTVALLAAGCGHAPSHGVVEGQFRLPAEPAAALRRGGLNFATGSKHGDDVGHTVRVDADGSYTVALPPGSYSVIGALSGEPGGPAPERCAATIDVTVTANSTTRADYVCRATPVTAGTP